MAGVHQQQKIENEPSEDVARWLLDSGRRRFPMREEGNAEVTPPAIDLPSAQHRIGSSGPRWSRLVLLGVLAVAYLQYFFADTLLDIQALRSLIVFAKSFAG
jgi:hypothetical protein